MDIQDHKAYKVNLDILGLKGSKEKLEQLAFKVNLGTLGPKGYKVFKVNLGTLDHKVNLGTLDHKVNLGTLDHKEIQDLDLLLLKHTPLLLH